MDLDLSSQVTCIVGANGLGKSTLINLILYGITGLVLRPQHRLIPIQGRGSSFIGQGREYARSYFDGRVARKDLDRARITVDFQLGPAAVQVTRGFLHNASVQSFTIDGRQPREQSEAAFQDRISRLAQAASFDHLSFLIHTTQLFGEEPLGLLWETPALNQVLIAAIGEDPAEGLQHAQLMDRFKRYDSLVRNIQWQISQEQKLVDDLAESLGDSPDELDEEVVDRYLELVGNKEREGLIETTERRQLDLEDAHAEARAKHDELHLKLQRVTSELEALTWRLITEQALPISESPLLSALQTQHICPVCRTAHQAVPLDIHKALESAECPLCHAKTRPAATGQSAQARAQLQRKVESLRAEIDDQAKATTSLGRDIASTKDRLHLLRAERESLERLHDRARLNAMRYARTTDQEGGLFRDKQRTIDTLKSKKEKHLKVRDKAKQELRRSQAKLDRTFNHVREEFVPIFQTLAEEFLGLPLNLTTKTRSVKGVPLVEVNLSLEGEGRRNPEELSASQRYFLDIALRMTILGWLGTDEHKPILVVDTPEGSLDVAYEANAGAMFARFARDFGGHLITVSNLNSSRLIRETISGCLNDEIPLKLFDLREFGRVNDVQEQRSALMDEQVKNLRELLHV